jgi:polyisoprenoid-binding protein YceI
LIVLASVVTAAHLVVFQQDGTLVNRDFTTKALPRLRELAKARGITLDLRDARAGAPDEVHTTPLLVYQDASGRSIFRGRYTDFERISQFLRTVRSGPLANAETTHENVAAWRRGRTVVIAPIKITALSGVLPARYDEHAFMDRARRAILSGFKRFRDERRVVASPSDRSFYMDFHPYRDAAGRLFVSTAIYSGFNCVEPILQGFDEPIAGEWVSPDDVFARAGKLLEDRIAQMSVSSDAGDAFDPVADDAPTKTWAALGLALPPAPPTAGARAAASAVALPRRFVVATASAEDPPRLQFRFAVPLDSYNGEVRKLTGTVVLGEGSRLNGATGTFDAATASVTMGSKALDVEIRNAMLRTDAFPGARFVLDPVEAADTALVPGVPAPFTATGHLEMLGVSVPLSVKAQAEVGSDEDGTPRLDVQARFRFRIGSTFGLKGPDGPAPANDTLEFDARFALKPEATVSPTASR